jgi:hypothetical protein
MHQTNPSERELSTPPQPDPQSVERPEAETWVGFYRELLAFEERALARMRELAAGASDAIKAEVTRSNIEPLETLIDDLRGQLEKWEDRERELAGR